MGEDKSIRRVEITVDRRVRSLRVYGTPGLKAGEPCPLCGRLLEATLESPRLETGPGPEPEPEPEQPALPKSSTAK
jgi:hypothetical protein